MPKAVGRRGGGKSEERERRASIQPIYRAVGTRISQARRDAGLTQEKLSERVHISQNLLARIESGSRRIPLHTLEAVARALKIAMVELLPQGRGPAVSPALLQAFGTLTPADQAQLRQLANRLQKGRGPAASVKRRTKS